MARPPPSSSSAFTLPPVMRIFPAFCAGRSTRPMVSAPPSRTRTSHSSPRVSSAAVLSPVRLSVSWEPFPRLISAQAAPSRVSTTSREGAMDRRASRLSPPVTR